ncbi:MAG: (deoxy)nucleoside triphosphate pyrophosphohydrolase [Desulfobacterales bacterium]|nr:(deoxy)nucleoside triphosphate pyrophosphohydrolase [Desulfobacterales bacterium]
MKGQNEKPHYHVTAALIRKKGSFLIAKRPQGSHLEGYWEFPGGKQEQGESLEECLEREIREELGLRVKTDRALLTVDHDYGSKAISLHVFNCTCLAGEPKALEGQEIRWVAPGDFFKFFFPPPDMKVLEFLFRTGNGKEG